MSDFGGSSHFHFPLLCKAFVLSCECAKNDFVRELNVAQAKELEVLESKVQKNARGEKIFDFEIEN